MCLYNYKALKPLNKTPCKLSWRKKKVYLVFNKLKDQIFIKNFRLTLPRILRNPTALVLFGFVLQENRPFVIVGHHIRSRTFINRWWKVEIQSSPKFNQRLHVYYSRGSAGAVDLLVTWDY